LDADHASHRGLSQALHLAQVVYGAPGDTAGGGGFGCGDGEGCCGAAPVPGTFPTDFSDLDATLRGASLYRIASNCKYRTSAHELGHSVGLEHDGEEEPYPWGFMNDASNDGSELSSTNRDRLDSSVRYWDWPRPSGFRWGGG
jgi:hypothetical protein